MKKYLLTTIAVLIIGFGRLYAQQEPQLTHYMFNKLVFNPAAAGETQGLVTITGLIHDQWTDFKSPEGELAPKTQTASIDGSIKLNEAKATRLGLGFNFLKDNEAFINSTGFMLSAAYIMPVNFLGGGQLSAGFNAGMIDKSLTPNWKPVDRNDPLLPGTISNTAFDAGIGVYFSSYKWWAGISALHLPGAKIDWSTPNDPKWHGTAVYDVAQTYFLTAGYKYELPSSPDFRIEPSVLIKKDPARLSLSASGLVYWKSLIYGGLNVRTENVTAMALMVGLYKTLPKGGSLRVGYSYDIATQIPTPFGGTHELLVSYQFRIITHEIQKIWDKSVRFL